jgi:nucleoside-diphosphate-sugar epimerase
VNVGSDEAISIAEVLEYVARQIGRPELLKLGARPAPADEPPILIPNMDRLRDEVGWKPKWKLDAGLIDAIGWWRRQLGRTSAERP